MKLYSATIPADALKVRSKTSYYARQKNLFVMLVIVISLTPLLVISWTSSHFYRQSWQKQTSLSLASLAESRKEVIDLFLSSQEDILSSLVALHSKAELEKPGALNKVFAAINSSKVIIDLGVIDESGRHLAYVGPFKQKLLDKNYGASPWFSEAMKNGRYISDVFEGFRGVPHFVVAVASPDRSWLLRATVNSELFNKLLESAEVGPGGDAYLVNIGGEFQTPSRLGLTALPKAEQAMLMQAGEGGDVHAWQNSLYATARLNNGAWLLVLKTDIDTSLKEFYQARNRDFVIIICAALIILVVSTVLIRTMVNQIEKADGQRIGLLNRIRQAEKMGLVGRLAAGVAHEINNPLQIIGDQAGWIDELLDDDRERQLENLKEYRNAAGKIRDQVKRASAITHRLLGFSRKESGRGLVDLNKLLDETVSFLENEARKHRILIRKNFSEIGQVFSDGAQLQQVILNILNNAIDAVGEDGAITVSTGRTADRLTIEFADTGPGLSGDDLKRIFDPFFTTKEKEKGTGLGLSISYSIMQRLGGEILARNGETGGSVFTVVLPAGKSTDTKSLPRGDISKGLCNE
ncbi:MAG: sensor histidine kinase [Desulfurivibrionaceae bacterium]|nr:sensor histidine kinase [Desulfobacterales bacterium]MDT8335364.1 sensor histidine kinase [Desulfurivibrionaceae bacterium]